MLVLGALCVLLPLVVSLDTCDPSIVECFRAEDQLPGNLLANFAERNLWFVAVASKGAANANQSITVFFGSVVEDTVTGKFVYRNSSGYITSTVFATYSLVGDHLVFKEKDVHFIQCSENLIAGYRCQHEGTTGVGPKYFVWAAWDKTEAVVSAELESCLAKIKKGDPSAAFALRAHPDPEY